MYKIAVTGAYDSIFGFAALGLDTFPVSGAEDLVILEIVDGAKMLPFKTKIVDVDNKGLFISDRLR